MGEFDHEAIADKSSSVGDQGYSGYPVATEDVLDIEVQAVRSDNEINPIGSAEPCECSEAWIKRELVKEAEDLLLRCMDHGGFLQETIPGGETAGFPLGYE